MVFIRKDGDFHGRNVSFREGNTSHPKIGLNAPKRKIHRNSNHSFPGALLAGFVSGGYPAAEFKAQSADTNRSTLGEDRRGPWWPGCHGICQMYEIWKLKHTVNQNN